MHFSDPHPKPEEKPEEASDGGGGEASQEIGGRKGPDPTRYGDWEIGGKCVDF